MHTERHIVLLHPIGAESWQLLQGPQSAAPMQGSGKSGVEYVTLGAHEVKGPCGAVENL